MSIVWRTGKRNELGTLDMRTGPSDISGIMLELYEHSITSGHFYSAISFSFFASL